jgi:hypothetical protein
MSVTPPIFLDELTQSVCTVAPFALALTTMINNDMLTEYVRTHTRPEFCDRPEWQAGYRFRGKVTGGGIAEKYHPVLGPRVHSAECVRLA